MRLSWLPDVVSAAGLKTVIEDGWESRGRDFVDPLRGIVVHHTATPASVPGDYPSLRIVRDGRVDLPGPIAQLGLGRSGTVYVIAAGRANHAGVGSWPGLFGNRDTIGIEAEHPGLLSHPWPSAQLAAYYRLCAALADHAGIPTDKVIAHKEWAPTRKIDPIGLHMGHFRDSVQAIRDGGDMKPPSWAIDATQWHIDNSIYTESRVEDVDEDIEFHRQTVFRHRFYQRVVAPALRTAQASTVDQVARNGITAIRDHLKSTP